LFATPLSLADLPCFDRNRAWLLFAHANALTSIVPTWKDDDKETQLCEKGRKVVTALLIGQTLYIRLTAFFCRCSLAARVERG
jgi:hypothetical protein